MCEKLYGILIALIAVKAAFIVYCREGEAGEVFLLSKDHGTLIKLAKFSGILQQQM